MHTNTTKKKIAILSLLRGGIGHYIAQISPYLSEDYDLTYISYKFGLPGDEVTLDDPAIKNNITSEPFFIIRYNDYKEINQSLGETVGVLKKENINVLNVHVGTIARETVYFLIPLVLAAKELGIKILYTFHDVEPFEKYLPGQEVLKEFYNLADGGTVGNLQEQKLLIDKYEFPKEKLILAEHGIYTIFDFNKYDKESARKHLGISMDKKVILNFGILRPYKGFDDTIKAMPELLKKDSNYFLHISAGVRVFGGPEDLIKLNKELHLENDSKMDFDYVPSDEIEPIFKSADVVVLPYKQVSQSGILNLALYFKKPVIISNLFMEKDEINNKLGLVVEPGDPNKIADAIHEILGDAELYKKYQENISQYIKNDRWQEATNNYKKIIEDILR